MEEKMQAKNKYYSSKLHNKFHVIEEKANAKKGVPRKIHIKAFPTGSPKKGESPFTAAIRRDSAHTHNALRNTVVTLGQKLAKLRHQAENKVALTDLKERVHDAQEKLARLKDEEEDRVELAHFPKKVRLKLEAVHAAVWKQKMAAWKAEKLKKLQEEEKQAVARVARDERTIMRTKTKLTMGEQGLRVADRRSNGIYTSSGADLSQMPTPPAWTNLEAQSKRLATMTPKAQLRTLKQGLSLMRQQQHDVQAAMLQQQRLIKETETQIHTNKHLKNAP